MNQRTSYSFYRKCPEWDLTRAAYRDDIEAVRKILEDNPSIDVNEKFTGCSRGNGSPLVLTGSVEIAELLISKGADINLVNGLSEKFTALDSAYKELTKLKVRESSEKTAKINELITFLIGNGGLKYSEIYS